MLRLILASASPRRRQLIQLFGLPIEIVVAAVDENAVAVPDSAENARQTALLKARAVAADVDGDAVVIGSDTNVAVDGAILGKPRDDDEARTMLRQLRERVHQVHTGIALINTATGTILTDVATVDVPMRPYADAEIEAYIATGDPRDKAGAYAIQHPEFQPVVALSGCYAGVMGLPLCHLARALRQLGVTWPTDIATACQVANDFDCSVYDAILSGE
ncbi:MAG: Maf family protein [Anaerolineae bacterium]|nr:Maf family protein [Anaerolineae bacterium]